MTAVELRVFLNQIPIGTLAQKEGKVYFEYEKAFLETGIEISPYKLPLKVGVQRCDDDTFEGLWGVFADSLPDGWGRLLMDRHLMRLGVNPQSVTPIERLSYVGDYGMGALRYEPVKQMDEPMTQIVLDDLAQRAEAIIEGSNDTMLDTLLALGGSSAGARPKVLVQLREDQKHLIHGRQKLREGYTHAMVKFANSIDGEESGAVEYAYSLMAKTAGIEMPETYLLEGRRGRYFAVKRFDRIGNKRVHMHSVAGLVHADFRLPTLDYDDLLALTWHLTKNYRDLLGIFRLACFNLFAHNRDDHAKNFSFLMDDKGAWRLSPAYDLTFSFGPGGEHSTMYLGEGRHPARTHLQALGEKHAIKECGKIIEEVADAVSQWSAFAKEAEIKPSMASTIEKYFVFE